MPVMAITDRLSAESVPSHCPDLKNRPIDWGEPTMKKREAEEDWRHITWRVTAVIKALTTGKAQMVTA